MPTATLKSPKYPDLRNYLGGAPVDADLPRLELNDPSTGEVIARVPLSTRDEVDAAVEAAAAAFPAWSALPIKERVQVFYRYKALLEQHIEELAALITEENGKTLAESRAGLHREWRIARQVMERASAGMIGVNVGVPVPREPFSFGGWNESRFGVGDITGRGSLELWTQTKKLMTKWNTTGR